MDMLRRLINCRIIIIIIIILCKFGRNRAICVVVEAICAKSLQETDDGRRAIVLAHGMS